MWSRPPQRLTDDVDIDNDAAKDEPSLSRVIFHINDETDLSHAVQIDDNQSGETIELGLLKNEPKRNSVNQVPASLQVRDRGWSVEGRISVEMHLELYIEDLMILAPSSQSILPAAGGSNSESAAAASGTLTPTSKQSEALTSTSDQDRDSAPNIYLNDILNGIAYLFQTRIHGQISHLTGDICNRLLIALCHHIRRTEKGWAMKPKVTESAQLALQILACFVEEVKEFQDAIELFSITELSAALKLNRHLRVPNEAHRQMVLRLLSFLAFSFPKFADWRVFLKVADADVSSQVNSYLSAWKSSSLPSSFHKREVGLPPKGSYYDTREHQVITMFRTDVEKGLTSEEVIKRRELYGSNELPRAPPESLFKMVAKQFTDFIVLVLVAAAVISAAVEDYKATVVLLIVVIINGVIGFVQEYRAKQALEALSSLSVPQAQVVRDGVQSMIDSVELVPGDVVQLDEGMNVPADLRLIECSQLGIIEALLTGEPIAVVKNPAVLKGRRNLPLGDRINMAFMSTLVAKGRGVGIVVNTGSGTQVGRIVSSIRTADSHDTPLQKKLAALGKWLVLVSIISCALIVGIGIARGYGTDIIHHGIALAVSVIPEGLITVVTLTMALGMQKMSRENAIVRQLPAVETLGAITTICSDKTGTLTLGRMNATELWSYTKINETPSENTTSNSTVQYSGSVKLLNQPTKLTLPILSPSTRMSLAISALCNNARISVVDGVTKEVGDATEIALVQMCINSDANINYWNELGLNRVLEFAFDSDRKRMSVIVTLPQQLIDDGYWPLMGIKIPPGMTHILLSKGAPEAIFDFCQYGFVPVDNDNVNIESIVENAEYEQAVEKEGVKLASAGMRVLALGMKFLDTKSVNRYIELCNKPINDADEISGVDQASAECEHSLTFVGLVGLMDPARPEVETAVRQCQVASIRVVMITGDHHATAISIARQIGIYQDKYDRALNGDALSVLNEEQLAALEPFPVVFSRVSPENKLKIVRALQKRGEICAMTGDGVNDAPAIKQANVGIAMGQAGTEVTRQAADIVLADDNFATIVIAIQEGRRIFDNILKFLIYLLSCNAVEVLVMLAAITFNLPIPYESLMMLWANIFVDVPPSLSLGVEPVESTAMSKPPRPVSMPILTKFTATVMSINIIEQSIMVLVVYWYMMEHQNMSTLTARTLAFELVGALHIVHSFLSRSLTETMFTRYTITSNMWMYYSAIIAQGFMMAGCYVPGLYDILALTPIGGLEWGIIVICCFVHVIFIETEKSILRSTGWGQEESTSDNFYRQRQRAREQSIESRLEIEQQQLTHH